MCLAVGYHTELAFPRKSVEVTATDQLCAGGGTAVGWQATADPDP